MDKFSFFSSQSLLFNLNDVSNQNTIKYEASKQDRRLILYAIYCSKM